MVPSQPNGDGSRLLYVQKLGPGRGLGPLSQWVPRSANGCSARAPSLAPGGVCAGPLLGDLDAPGPWVPLASPEGSQILSASAKCARAHAHSHPSPRGRCALGRRPMRLRDARHPPEVHSAAGPPERPRPAEECTRIRAFVPGAKGPRARDSPCCWDPWPRCAGGSSCARETLRFRLRSGDCHSDFQYPLPKIFTLVRL